MVTYDHYIVYEENFKCHVIYQRLAVGSVGLVLQCIYDENGDRIIGNAHHQTIYEIWHSDQLKRTRQVHSRGNFFELAVCRKCLLPRKQEFDERAYIDDRTIWIPNYINRAQEIGK